MIFDSFCVSLLPSPFALLFFLFFLPGHLESALGWVLLVCQWVDDRSCLQQSVRLVQHLSLFLLPFLYTFRGVCFGFWLWLTCGVGEAGLTLVDQRSDCICACFALLWVFLSLLLIVHVQLYLFMLPFRCTLFYLSVDIRSHFCVSVFIHT